MPEIVDLQELYVTKLKEMQIALIVFIAALTGISNTMDCRCEDPGTVKEAFAYTEAIFHGKVISKEFITYEDSMEPEKAVKVKEFYKEDQQKIEWLQARFIIKLELELINTFKGKILTDTLTLYTTRTGVSCGFTRFDINQDYIVYASSKSYAYWPFGGYGETASNLERPNTYWTNHCTRTCEYNKLEESELLVLSNK